MAKEQTPMQRMNEANAKAAELLLEEMQEVRLQVPRDKGRADMLAKLGGVMAELRIGAEPWDAKTAMQAMAATAFAPAVSSGEDKNLS